MVRLFGITVFGVALTLVSATLEAETFCTVRDIKTDLGEFRVAFFETQSNEALKLRVGDFTWNVAGLAEALSHSAPLYPEYLRSLAVESTAGLNGQGIEWSDVSVFLAGSTSLDCGGGETYPSAKNELATVARLLQELAMPEANSTLSTTDEAMKLQVQSMRASLRGSVGLTDAPALMRKKRAEVSQKLPHRPIEVSTTPAQRGIKPAKPQAPLSAAFSSKPKQGARKLQDDGTDSFFDTPVYHLCADCSTALLTGFTTECKSTLVQALDMMCNAIITAKGPGADVTTIPACAVQSECFSASPPAECAVAVQQLCSGCADFPPTWCASCIGATEGGAIDATCAAGALAWAGSICLTEPDHPICATDCTSLAGALNADGTVNEACASFYTGACENCPGVTEFDPFQAYVGDLEPYNFHWCQQEASSCYGALAPPTRSADQCASDLVSTLGWFCEYVEPENEACTGSAEFGLPNCNTPNYDEKDCSTFAWQICNPTFAARRDGYPVEMCEACALYSDEELIYFTGADSTFDVDYCNHALGEFFLFSCPFPILAAELGDACASVPAFGSADRNPESFGDVTPLELVRSGAVNAEFLVKSFCPYYSYASEVVTECFNAPRCCGDPSTCCEGQADRCSSTGSGTGGATGSHSDDGIVDLGGFSITDVLAGVCGVPAMCSVCDRRDYNPLLCPGTLAEYGVNRCGPGGEITWVREGQQTDDLLFCDTGLGDDGSRTRRLTEKASRAASTEGIQNAINKHLHKHDELTKALSNAKDMDTVFVNSIDRSFAKTRRTISAAQTSARRRRLQSFIGEPLVCNSGTTWDSSSMSCVGDTPADGSGVTCSTDFKWNGMECVYDSDSGCSGPDCGCDGPDCDGGNDNEDDWTGELSGTAILALAHAFRTYRGDGVISLLMGPDAASCNVSPSPGFCEVCGEESPDTGFSTECKDAAAAMYAPDGGSVCMNDPLHPACQIADCFTDDAVFVEQCIPYFYRHCIKRFKRPAICSSCSRPLMDVKAGGDPDWTGCEYTMIDHASSVCAASNGESPLCGCTSFPAASSADCSQMFLQSCDLETAQAARTTARAAVTDRPDLIVPTVGAPSGSDQVYDNVCVPCGLGSALPAYVYGSDSGSGSGSGSGSDDDNDNDDNAIMFLLELEDACLESTIGFWMSACSAEGADASSPACVCALTNFDGITDAMTNAHVIAECVQQLISAPCNDINQMYDIQATRKLFCQFDGTCLDRTPSDMEDDATLATSCAAASLGVGPYYSSSPEYCRICSGDGESGRLLQESIPDVCLNSAFAYFAPICAADPTHISCECSTRNAIETRPECLTFFQQGCGGAITNIPNPICLACSDDELSGASSTPSKDCIDALRSHNYYTCLNDPQNGICKMNCVEDPFQGICHDYYNAACHTPADIRIDFGEEQCCGGNIDITDDSCIASLRSHRTVLCSADVVADLGFTPSVCMDSCGGDGDVTDECAPLLVGICHSAPIPIETRDYCNILHDGSCDSQFAIPASTEAVLGDVSCQVNAFTYASTTCTDLGVDVNSRPDAIFGLTRSALSCMSPSPLALLDSASFWTILAFGGNPFSYAGSGDGGDSSGGGSTCVPPAFCTICDASTGPTDIPEGCIIGAASFAQAQCSADSSLAICSTSCTDPSGIVVDGTPTAECFEYFGDVCCGEDEGGPDDGGDGGDGDDCSPAAFCAPCAEDPSGLGCLTTGFAFVTSECATRPDQALCTSGCASPATALNSDGTPREECGILLSAFCCIDPSDLPTRRLQSCECGECGDACCSCEGGDNDDGGDSGGFVTTLSLAYGTVYGYDDLFMCTYNCLSASDCVRGCPDALFGQCMPRWANRMPGIQAVMCSDDEDGSDSRSDSDDSDDCTPLGFCETCSGGDDGTVSDQCLAGAVAAISQVCAADSSHPLCTNSCTTAEGIVANMEVCGSMVGSVFCCGDDDEGDDGDSDRREDPRLLQDCIPASYCSSCDPSSTLNGQCITASASYAAATCESDSTGTLCSKCSTVEDVSANLDACSAQFDMFCCSTPWPSAADEDGGDDSCGDCTPSAFCSLCDGAGESGPSAECISGAATAASALCAIDDSHPLCTNACTSVSGIAGNLDSCGDLIGSALCCDCGGGDDDSRDDDSRTGDDSHCDGCNPYGFCVSCDATVSDSCVNGAADVINSVFCDSTDSTDPFCTAGCTTAAAIRGNLEVCGEMIGQRLCCAECGDDDSSDAGSSNGDDDAQCLGSILSGGLTTCGLGNLIMPNPTSAWDVPGEIVEMFANDYLALCSVSSEGLYEQLLQTVRDFDTCYAVDEVFLRGGNPADEPDLCDIPSYVLKWAMTLTGTDLAPEMLPALARVKTSALYRNMYMFMCSGLVPTNAAALFDPACFTGCADKDAPDSVRGQCGNLMADSSPMCASDPEALWCADADGGGDDTSSGGGGVGGGDGGVDSGTEDEFPSFCDPAVCGGQAGAQVDGEPAPLSDTCTASLTTSLIDFCKYQFSVNVFPDACECFGVDWTRGADADDYERECDQAFSEACAFPAPLPSLPAPRPRFCEVCDLTSLTDPSAECAAAVDFYTYARCTYDPVAADLPICSFDTRCRGREGLAQCAPVLLQACGIAETIQAEPLEMCVQCADVYLPRATFDTDEGTACLTAVLNSHSDICSLNGHYAGCRDDFCASENMDDECVEAISLACGFTYGTCARGCTQSQVGDGICQKACFESESCANDMDDCQYCQTSLGFYGFCEEPTIDIDELIGSCDDRGECQVRFTDASRTTIDLTATGITWIGDGICDTACLTDSCNQDGGDCDLCADDRAAVVAAGKSVENFCNPECSIQMLFNDCCDPECNTECCSFDFGSCDAETGTTECSVKHEVQFNSQFFCAAGCRHEWVNDGYCDAECRVEGCDFDLFDCFGCADDVFGEDCVAELFDESQVGFCKDASGVDTQCKQDWIGDGFCSPEEEANCVGDCLDPDCAGGVNFGEVDFATSLCAPGCPDTLIDNGFCDPACDVADCGNDGSDCSEPVCACGQRRLKNLVCDLDCNTEVCGFDNGDCVGCTGDEDGECSGVYCAAGCHESMLGDGTCQPECNNADCSQDHGDCAFCDADSLCHDSMVGNGLCDASCNNEACSFDSGDCEVATEEEAIPTDTCAADCPRTLLGNRKCNFACNNAACNNDNGDCEFCDDTAVDGDVCPEPLDRGDTLLAECAAGCKFFMTLDNRCQDACNVAACDNDNGACAADCNTGCTTVELLNDVCDDACNVEACGFDNGVCNSPLTRPVGTPDIYDDDIAADISTAMGCTPGDGSYLEGSAQYCPRKRLINLGSMGRKAAEALTTSVLSGLGGERDLIHALGSAISSVTELDDPSPVRRFTSALLLSATVDGVSTEVFDSVPGDGSAGAWQIHFNSGSCSLKFDTIFTSSTSDIPAITVEAPPADTCSYDAVVAAIGRFEDILSVAASASSDRDREAVRRLAVAALRGEGSLEACVEHARSLGASSHSDDVFIRNTRACLDPTDLTDPCCHKDLQFYQCCAPRDFVSTVEIYDSFGDLATQCPTGTIDQVQSAIQTLALKWRSNFELGVCDASSDVNECTEPALISVVDTCETRVYGSDGAGPSCRYQSDCEAGICDSATARCLMPADVQTRLFFDCFTESINPNLWSFLLLDLGLASDTSPDTLFPLFESDFVRPICVGPTGSSFRDSTELTLADPTCEDSAQLCERVETTVTATESQCTADRQCNWFSCAAALSTSECAGRCATGPAACYKCAADTGSAGCQLVTKFATCTNPYAQTKDQCTGVGGRWNAARQTCLYTASTEAECLSTSPTNHCPAGVIQTSADGSRSVCPGYCYNPDLTEEQCDSDTVLFGTVYRVWDSDRSTCVLYNPTYQTVDATASWCSNVARGSIFTGRVWTAGEYTTEEECGKGFCNAADGNTARTSAECDEITQCTGQCSSCVSSTGLDGVCMARGVVIASDCDAAGGSYDSVERVCVGAAADAAACDALTGATWEWVSCGVLTDSECSSVRANPLSLDGGAARGAYSLLKCSVELQSCPLGAKCASGGVCDDIDLVNPDTNQPGVCTYRFQTSECGEATCGQFRQTAYGCADDRITSEAACDAAHGSWHSRARTSEQCLDLKVCTDAAGRRYPGRSEDECNDCGDAMRSVYTWTSGSAAAPRHTSLRWRNPEYQAVNEWTNAVDVARFKSAISRVVARFVFDKEIARIRCMGSISSSARKFACMCGSSTVDCGATELGITSVDLGSSTCPSGSDAACEVGAGSNTINTGDLPEPVIFSMGQVDSELSTAGSAEDADSRRRRLATVVTTYSIELVQLAPALTISTDQPLSILTSTSVICVEVPLTVDTSIVTFCSSASTSSGSSLVCEPTLSITVTQRADGQICFSAVLADIATQVSATSSIIFAPMQEVNVTSTDIIPDPVDCVVAEWSTWSNCSAPCATGSRSRTRAVTTVNQHGGTVCPELAQSETCNVDPCVAPAAKTVLSTRLFGSGETAATFYSSGFANTFREGVASVAGPTVSPEHVFITTVTDVTVEIESRRRLLTPSSALEVDYYIENGADGATQTALETAVQSSIDTGAFASALCSAGSCGLSIVVTPDADDDSGGLGLGAIIGIAIGGVLVLGLIVGVVVVLNSKSSDQPKSGRTSPKYDSPAAASGGPVAPQSGAPQSVPGPNPTRVASDPINVRPGDSSVY